MKKYPTVLDCIAGEFPKKGIPFVLVGGFAVNAYGYSRNTQDVDFMIDEKNYPRALKLLIEGGCKELIKTEMFAKFESPKGYPREADLLFVDSMTFAGILKSGTQIKIAGYECFIPSVRHLIAMKLHAIKNNPAKRESKDLLDILELVKLHHIDVLSDDFKELCLKFGHDALYKKITDYSK